MKEGSSRIISYPDTTLSPRSPLSPILLALLNQDQGFVVVGRVALTETASTALEQQALAG